MFLLMALASPFGASVRILAAALGIRLSAEAPGKAAGDTMELLAAGQGLDQPRPLWPSGERTRRWKSRSSCCLAF